MWTRSVRATNVERSRALPGDDLIPAPIGTLTHAVTIGCPRREVWPWIAQMGAGSRAGWYSYDAIDNGGHPSADRIIPELQRVAIGALFPAVPGAVDGFHVLQCDIGRHLILGWRPSANAAPIVTWAFVLDEVDPCTTRVVVRVRAASGYPFYGLPPMVGMPVIRAGHFIMQRRQLLGIARRAESAHAALEVRIRTDVA